MKPKRRFKPEATTTARGARDADPYTALAAGYDAVMRHVDYEHWADYIHTLLARHHGHVASILELGCGTGTLAIHLQPQGPYAYTATDRSAAMIAQAQAKAGRWGRPIRFDVADFTRFDVDAPVDAVILLYDGMNYLLDLDAMRDLLRAAHDALAPGGLFIFDQSTPANSLNNEAFFHDEGEVDGFRYRRGGHYDRDRQHHITTFTITTAAGTTYHERHVQRAYALGAIRALIRATPFEEVALYDQLTDDPADETTERIHWVLRRPA